MVGSALAVTSEPTASFQLSKINWFGTILRAIKKKKHD